MGEDLGGLDVGRHDDDGRLSALDDLGDLVGSFLDLSAVPCDLGEGVRFVRNFLGGLEFHEYCHFNYLFQVLWAPSLFIGSKRAYQDYRMVI